MPAPRSTDLRERIVALVATGMPRIDIAHIMGVSLRSLERYLRLNRIHGSPAPLPYTPGRPRLLSEELLTCLADICLDEPDHYLEELQERVNDEWNEFVSLSTIGRALKRQGFTHKQLSKRAKERNEEKRLAYCRTLASWMRPDQCVYVDESAKDNRDCYRRWGWGLKGQKATKLESFKRGKKYSLVAAIAFDGMLTSRAIEGSVNNLQFFDFVVECMLPEMNPYPGPKSVIIMDNCAIHKLPMLIEAIESRGVVVLFLPAYSPDMNPIEGAFHQIKQDLRKNGPYYLETHGGDGLIEAAFKIDAHRAR